MVVMRRRPMPYREVFSRQVACIYCEKFLLGVRDALISSHSDANIRVVTMAADDPMPTFAFC